MIKMPICCTSRWLTLAVFAFASSSQPLFAQSSPAGPALSLKEALVEALRSSRVLRAPATAKAAAEVRQEFASAAFDVKFEPSLSAGTGAQGLNGLGAGIGLSKRLLSGADVRIAADTTSYLTSIGPLRDVGYSLDVRQPLLRGLGPGRTADLVSARRGVTTADRALRQSEQDLIIDVARAYFDVVRQQRLVAAGEQARDRADNLRRASEARVQVGLATQLDVLRADLLVSQTDATLSDQREMLAASLDRLNLLLGRPLDSSMQIAEDGAQIPAELTTIGTTAGLEELIALATASRLEIAEARERLQNAERETRIAQWNLLPQIDLRATYSRRGLGGPSASLLNDPTEGWRIGMSTTYGFDRSAGSAAVATSRLGIQTATVVLEDVRQRVAVEVRAAWRGRERAEGVVAIQEKAVEIAEKQLRLAQLRYGRGLAGNFDVVDAEGQLFQAWSALIAAQLERELSLLILSRAAGTLNAERLMR